MLIQIKAVEEISGSRPTVWVDIIGHTTILIINFKGLEAKIEIIF